ncbi:MAG: malonic semialdehyde reductase [Hyphomicrobiales bacterium]
MNASAPQTQDLDLARSRAQDDVRELRSRISHLSEDEIGLMLTRARSHYAWQDRPVTDAQLKQIYDITKMGSTSMNCCPARFVFVKSTEGKERLVKALKPTNVQKVMKAPVTAIIAFDKEFWKELPRLFPHEDRRGHFRDKEKHSYVTAFRNSTLQGGYFMMAARAIGLDTGPLSGFSNEIVDEEFFAGTTLASNFLCNVGYADESALFQRLPRFDFEDVCTFA